MEEVQEPQSHQEAEVKWKMKNQEVITSGVFALLILIDKNSNYSLHEVERRCTCIIYSLYSLNYPHLTILSMASADLLGIQGFHFSACSQGSIEMLRLWVFFLY